MLFKNKRVKYQEDPNELAFPVAYYVNMFLRESGFSYQDVAKQLGISNVEALDFLNGKTKFKDSCTLGLSRLFGSTRTLLELNKRYEEDVEKGIPTVKF